MRVEVRGRERHERRRRARPLVGRRVGAPGGLAGRRVGRLVVGAVGPTGRAHGAYGVGGLADGPGARPRRLVDLVVLGLGAREARDAGGVAAGAGLRVVLVAARVHVVVGDGRLDRGAHDVLDVVEREGLAVVPPERGGRLADRQRSRHEAHVVVREARVLGHAVEVDVDGIQARVVADAVGRLEGELTHGLLGRGALRQVVAHEAGVGALARLEVGRLAVGDGLVGRREREGAARDGELGRARGVLVVAREIPHVVVDVAGVGDVGRGGRDLGAGLVGVCREFVLGGVPDLVGPHGGTRHGDARRVRGSVVGSREALRLGRERAVGDDAERRAGEGHLVVGVLAPGEVDLVGSHLVDVERRFLEGELDAQVVTCGNLAVDGVGSLVCGEVLLGELCAREAVLVRHRDVLRRDTHLRGCDGEARRRAHGRGVVRRSVDHRAHVVGARVGRGLAEQGARALREVGAEAVLEAHGLLAEGGRCRGLGVTVRGAVARLAVIGPAGGGDADDLVRAGADGPVVDGAGGGVDRVVARLVPRERLSARAVGAGGGRAAVLVAAERDVVAVLGVQDARGDLVLGAVEHEGVARPGNLHGKREHREGRADVVDVVVVGDQALGREREPALRSRGGYVVEAAVVRVEGDVAAELSGLAEPLGGLARKQPGVADVDLRVGCRLAVRDRRRLCRHGHPELLDREVHAAELRLGKVVLAVREVVHDLGSRVGLRHARVVDAGHDAGGGPLCVGGQGLVIRHAAGVDRAVGVVHRDAELGRGVPATVARELDGLDARGCAVVPLGGGPGDAHRGRRRGDLVGAGDVADVIVVEGGRVHDPRHEVVGAAVPDGTDVAVKVHGRARLVLVARVGKGQPEIRVAGGEPFDVAAQRDEVLEVAGLHVTPALDGERLARDLEGAVHLGRGDRAPVLGVGQGRAHLVGARLRGAVAPGDPGLAHGGAAAVGDALILVDDPHARLRVLGGRGRGVARRDVGARVLPTVDGRLARPDVGVLGDRPRARARVLRRGDRVVLRLVCGARVLQGRHLGGVAADLVLGRVGHGVDGDCVAVLDVGDARRHGLVVGRGVRLAVDEGRLLARGQRLVDVVGRGVPREGGGQGHDPQGRRGIADRVVAVGVGGLGDALGAELVGSHVAVALVRLARAVPGGLEREPGDVEDAVGRAGLRALARGKAVPGEAQLRRALLREQRRRGVVAVGDGGAGRRDRELALVDARLDGAGLHAHVIVPRVRVPPDPAVQVAVALGVPHVRDLGRDGVGLGRPLDLGHEGVVGRLRALPEDGRGVARHALRDGVGVVALRVVGAHVRGDHDGQRGRGDGVAARDERDVVVGGEVGSAADHLGVVGEDDDDAVVRHDLGAHALARTPDGARRGVEGDGRGVARLRRVGRRHLQLLMVREGAGRERPREVALRDRHRVGRALAVGRDRDGTLGDGEPPPAGRRGVVAVYVGRHRRLDVVVTRRRRGAHAICDLGTDARGLGGNGTGVGRRARLEVLVGHRSLAEVRANGGGVRRLAVGPPGDVDGGGVGGLGDREGLGLARVVFCQRVVVRLGAGQARGRGLVAATHVPLDDRAGRVRDADRVGPVLGVGAVPVRDARGRDVVLSVVDVGERGGIPGKLDLALQDGERRPLVAHRVVRLSVRLGDAGGRDVVVAHVSALRVVVGERESGRVEPGDVLARREPGFCRGVERLEGHAAGGRGGRYGGTGRVAGRGRGVAVGDLARVGRHRDRAGLDGDARLPEDHVGLRVCRDHEVVHGIARAGAVVAHVLPPDGIRGDVGVHAREHVVLEVRHGVRVLGLVGNPLDLVDAVLYRVGEVLRQVVHRGRSRGDRASVALREAHRDAVRGRVVGVAVVRRVHLDVVARDGVGARLGRDGVVGGGKARRRGHRGGGGVAAGGRAGRVGRHRHEGVDCALVRLDQVAGDGPADLGAREDVLAARGLRVVGTHGDSGLLDGEVSGRRRLAIVARGGDGRPHRVVAGVGGHVGRVGIVRGAALLVGVAHCARTEHRLCRVSACRDCGRGGRLSVRPVRDGHRADGVDRLGDVPGVGHVGGQPVVARLGALALSGLGGDAEEGRGVVALGGPGETGLLAGYQLLAVCEVAERAHAGIGLLGAVVHERVEVLSLIPGDAHLARVDREDARLELDDVVRAVDAAGHDGDRGARVGRRGVRRGRAGQDVGVGERSRHLRVRGRAVLVLRAAAGALEPLVLDAGVRGRVAVADGLVVGPHVELCLVDDPRVALVGGRVVEVVVGGVRAAHALELDRLGHVVVDVGRTGDDLVDGVVPVGLDLELLAVHAGDVLAPVLHVLVERVGVVVRRVRRPLDGDGRLRDRRRHVRRLGQRVVRDRGRVTLQRERDCAVALEGDGLGVGGRILVLDDARRGGERECVAADDTRAGRIRSAALAVGDRTAGHLHGRGPVVVAVRRRRTLDGDRARIDLGGQGAGGLLLVIVGAHGVADAVGAVVVGLHVPEREGLAGVVARQGGRVLVLDHLGLPLVGVGDRVGAAHVLGSGRHGDGVPLAVVGSGIARLAHLGRTVELAEPPLVAEVDARAVPVVVLQERAGPGSQAGDLAQVAAGHGRMVGSGRVGVEVLRVACD